MKTARLFATLLLSSATAFAAAAPIDPTFTSFGALPGATYGGSGIPTDPSAVTTYRTVTLGLVAHQRFTGPNLLNNGAGTYYANPGTGSSPSGLEGATWNFGFYINDTANAIVGNPLTFRLFYDFDAATDTDMADLGVLELNNMFAAFPTFGGTATGTKQDSQNLMFNFLELEVLGLINAPPFTFDPLANGEYNFALVAYDVNGEVARSAINVVVGDVADVPEPGVFALMGLGLAGLSMARRRKQPK